MSGSAANGLQQQYSDASPLLASAQLIASSNQIRRSPYLQTVKESLGHTSISCYLPSLSGEKNMAVYEEKESKKIRMQVHVS